MRDALICEPLRTPTGCHGGVLGKLDRRQPRYGLETMYIGGGRGLAAVFELVS